MTALPGPARLWWRIEINKAGNVTSCEAVEHCDRSTRTVLYIRAVCREHALEDAAQWVERRRASMRKYEQRRRAERKAKGICESCRRKLAPGSKQHCPVHLAEAREYQRERTARKARGELTARTPVDPVELQAKEHARVQRFRRMTVQIPVVIAVFDQLDGRVASPFRQWLVDELALRGGRTAEAAE